MDFLKGIDETECDSEDGWWETSTGANFGAEIKAKIEHEISQRDQHIAELEAQISYSSEAYKRTIMEQCGDDEHHCACVPHLRRRIAELEAENRREYWEAVEIIHDSEARALAAESRADRMAVIADALAAELEAYENQEQDIIDLLDGNAAFLDKRHAEIDAKEEALEAENERLREALYRIDYVEAHDMGNLRSAAKSAIATTEAKCQNT